MSVCVCVCLSKIILDTLAKAEKLNGIFIHYLDYFMNTYFS